MHVQTTSFGCISDLLLRYLSCHLILCCRSRTATSRTMNVLTSKLAWMRSSELAGMRSHLEFDKVRRTTKLFTKQGVWLHPSTVHTAVPPSKRPAPVHAPPLKRLPSKPFRNYIIFSNDLKFWMHRGGLI